VTGAFVHMYNSMGHTTMSKSAQREADAMFKQQEEGLDDNSFLFIPIGKIFDGIGSIFSIFKTNHWFRVGNSFSRSSNVQTQGIRIGTNNHYRKQISNQTMQNLNKSLRDYKFPGKSWRVQDAGHIHFWRR